MNTYTEDNNTMYYHPYHDPTTHSLPDRYRPSHLTYPDPPNVNPQSTDYRMLTRRVI